MSLRESLLRAISEKPVLLYSKSWCPYCDQLKKLLVGMKVPFESVELDVIPSGSEMQAELAKINGGHRTVPMLWIGGKFVGGCDDTMKKERTGELRKLLAQTGVHSTAV